MGYKNLNLDAGYFYAPYIPLQYIPLQFYPIVFKIKIKDKIINAIQKFSNSSLTISNKLT